MFAALRRWVRPEAINSAEAVSTELVTNAARHAAGTIDLGLTISDDCLHIEVTDQVPSRVPMFRSPGADGGFGLHMVDGIAKHWGCERDATQKTVWADLDMTKRL